MNTANNVYTKLDRENIEAYTPKSAVDIILPYISKDLVIWAPFSLDEHHYADYLRSKGYKVINTHIKKGQDFLTYDPDFEFDIILDNPPFKDKAKFVEKAMSYKKPFAFFLPINSLGDKGIPGLYMDYNRNIELLIPRERTQFLNQSKRGISFKVVYICSDILPNQVIFTSLKK